MLRSLILLLIALNAAYFAWSQGHLAQFGWKPAPVSEPHRVAQQIKPEGLRLLPPDETKKLIAENDAINADKGYMTVKDAKFAAAEGAPTGTALACLVSGVLDEAQSMGVLAALGGQVPADSWRIDATPQPARWILYMGKFESMDLANRKRGELRALNVPTEALRNPAMEPGVSLGGHDNQIAANAALAKLATRGVRTARVVQERTEQRGFTLHVPQADEATRAKLEGLKALLGDKGLQPCPAPAMASSAASAAASAAVIPAVTPAVAQPVSAPLKSAPRTAP
jgi:hypothetical protein